MKIGLIGTHGIGKTSLAHSLIGELKSRGANAGMLREFVRECPLPTGTEENNSAEAQMWVLLRQVQEEIEAEKKFDIVVCDRSVIDIYAYFLSVRKKFGSSAELDKIAEEIFKNWGKTYSHVFKLPPAFSAPEDNFRSASPEWQTEIDRLVNANISELGIETHDVPLASLRDRVDSVLNVVKF